MSGDTNIFILVQLVILMGAGLVISLTFNWFLRGKVKQLSNYKTIEKSAQQTTRQHIEKELKAGVDAEQWNSTKEMSELGALSGRQLAISSQLKEMSTQSADSGAKQADRERFSRHIDELEESLFQSRKQINSVNHQFKQSQQDLQVERTKAAELKKQADHVPSLKLRETSLLDQAKQMNELIAAQEKEIKMLKLTVATAKGERETKAKQTGVVPPSIL